MSNLKTFPRINNKYRVAKMCSHKLSLVIMTRLDFALSYLDPFVDLVINKFVAKTLHIYYNPN